MADWTLTITLPGSEQQTESFTGELAWCDARDTLTDAYLDDTNPTHKLLATLLWDGNPDENVHLSIDGITLTLLPTDAKPSYPPLMEVIEALPQRSEDEYSWDERSSITGCAIALLEKLPASTRRAAAEDILDHFSDASGQTPVPVVAAETPEVPSFAYYVTSGTYVMLQADNAAARGLIGGQNSVEHLPDAPELDALLTAIDEANGVIDVGHEDTLSGSDLRDFIKEAGVLA